MLERATRLCLGLGLFWALSVVFVALATGFDTPGTWLGPSPDLDRSISPDSRRSLCLGLALLVVPLGMVTLLRKLYRTSGPLWLKAALPGMRIAGHMLFLAAAIPDVGRPLLQRADPLAARVLPAVRLTQDPGDRASWLVRFGMTVAVLTGGPWGLGLLAGLLAGGRRGG